MGEERCGHVASLDHQDMERSVSCQSRDGFRSTSVTSAFNVAGSLGLQSSLSNPLSSIPNPLPATPLGGTTQQTPMASLVGRARQQLREAVVQYCLRVLDQCERSESFESFVSWTAYK